MTARRNKLLKKVNWNPEHDFINTAISRLEGYLRYCPTDIETHNLVAELYFKTGDKLRAGKHYYFKPLKNEEEQNCVAAFEKSLGKDPLNILKKLIFKEWFKIKDSDPYSKEIIRQLISEIRKKYGLTPKFAQGMARYLDK